jgi:hypothetical protein
MLAPSEVALRLTLNRIVSNRTSEDIERLSDRFRAQEQALVDLDTQLRNGQTSLEATELTEGEADEGSERDSSLQLTAGLQKVCENALSATKARRTGQSFGDMQTDDHSVAMQGIAGVAQGKVEQSFGTLMTTKNSRAFQGQMGERSFAVMFGK